MKFNNLVLTTLIASLSGVVLADDSINYRYSGDSVGKQVCRAIVHDDVNKLQKVLRLYTLSLAYGYAFSDTTSDAIAGSFTCNDMALEHFSYTVDAHNVLGFLTNGRGIVEEQVVSTEK